MATGYRLAAWTLAIELLLAVVLVAPTLGLFAIFAIVIVGVAWIPAALLILLDLRRSRDPGSGRFGLAVAGLCLIAGMACLCTLAKWTLLGMLVK